MARIISQTADPIHYPARQDFVAYDEAIRIPLIFSNPKLFPEPMVNHSMVSNIDVAPTLARLAGVYPEFEPYLQGTDLVGALLFP